MALTDKLTAIADGFRESRGTTDKLSLDEMATLASVPLGGELPEEAFTITGDCNYRFCYNGWNWFIEEYGSRLTTKDITNATYMFYSNNKTNYIPFDINMKTDTDADMGNLFTHCYNLKELPRVNNAKPTAFDRLCSSCNKIEHIPDDYFDSWDFSYIASQTSGYSSNMSYLFSDCYALRKIPSSLFGQDKINKYASYSYTIYNSSIYNCIALDELIGLPVYDKSSMTSNAFRSFLNEGRIKRFTFLTNDDGSPIVCDNWKNQTIDLIKCGYVISTNYLLYNSTEITEEHKVYNEETYQELKDNPNWWTGLLAYSRYNHTSAVETINSLPDVSSGSGNTIKFGRNAGLNTDEGPCGNLTEEEIAVATARGWTVSFG